MRLTKFILHFYNFQKERGERSPLDDFIRDINPIILSTCMRHIYVFDESQIEQHKDSLKNLLTYLNEPRPHQTMIEYDYLQGVEAYAFLLLWSSGGLNKNKILDDDRVLDSLRKTCRGYEGSSSEKKRKSYKINQKFLNWLLLDAKRMHQVLVDLIRTPSTTEKSPQEKEELVALFREASTKCAENRHNDILDHLPKFDYANFFMDKENLELVIQSSLHETKEILQQKLLKLPKETGKNRLIFFSNPLASPDIRQKKIKGKISNLGDLMANFTSPTIDPLEESQKLISSVKADLDLSFLESGNVTTSFNTPF